MKKIFTGILAFIMSFILAGTALAEETSVEVKANFSPQTISFEISPAVTAATGKEDPTELNITPITVKNTMTGSSISITGMKAEGENGYSIVPDGSENWKDLTLDTKKLSILATIDSAVMDLSGEGFSGALTIDSGGSAEVPLSGHTAAVSAAVSETAVASIIVTVEPHIC